MRDRDASSRKSERRKALERMRSARHGESVVDSLDLKEDGLFEEVTEKEYEDLVRKRREAGPFVEEDGSGMGYYDDGEEAFFEDVDEHQQEEEDEDDGKKLKGHGALSKNYVRRMKRKHRAQLGDPNASTRVAAKFFTKGGNKPTGFPSKKPKKDIDLDEMLQDLESNPTENRYKKKTPSRSAKKLSSYSSYDSAFNDPVLESKVVVERKPPAVQEEEQPSYDDGGFPDMDVVSDENAGEPPVYEDKQEDEEEEKPKELSIREQLFKQAKTTTKKVSEATLKALENAKNPVPEEEEEEEKSSDPKASSVKPVIPSNEVPEWWSGAGTTAAPAVESETTSDLSAGEAGTVRMYWTDAIEIRDRPGKIYLTGKNNDGSCCVTVENLNRYLYVVPRIAKGQSPIAEMTKEERNELWMQMHNELQHILIPSCISDPRDQKCFATKLVERNYAFDNPDMPRGKSYYLKLKYAAKYPMPPQDICEDGGKSFTHIIGRTSRPVESFLVRRKLLGPGWIDIKNATKVTKVAASFCKQEYITSDPKNIVSVQGLPPPALTVMSIALKTHCHPETHKHQVVAVSCIVQSNVNCETATRDMNAFDHFTLIRPIDEKNGFPPEYKAALASDPRFQSKDTIRTETNERSLLTYFLTRVQKYDPDVLVGHNLHKYGLEVLLSRMDAYNLGGSWSRLTRLRRGRLNPYKVGEGWSEYSLEDLSNGRLLLDTYVAAKEFLPSQPTYSLTHLIQSQLGRTRQDVDIVDTPRLLDSGPEVFVNFCRHTSDDALFVLHLMHTLQILPLTKQLSTLCGYFWSRTVQANKRAERIEYLLLHEFDRAKPKFIVPDKELSSKSGDPKKKGPAYSGGMVFAPIKGLYENFVVLLDFNSLYPSIIREYNICFTTIEPSGDEIPELPGSTKQEGILPSVIKRLLELRKVVKKELKVELSKNNDQAAKRLDIRQKAIKLTANSIYGCLGFKHSRFYAKPIAALITQTGRSTLQRAQQVAENECGYQVVYGDTDSIMVDSRTNDLKAAKRIGYDIQSKCNKKFKLLELEVEHIFHRILLLNKKKYAALVIHDDGTLKKEVKGLDMVRRDWCQLSKIVGNQVLDYILSSTDSRDDVVDKIHAYLQTVRESIEKEPCENFIITKSLNKPPEKYPDKAKQYHVQVALALKQQGQPIGAGIHIPYVICEQEEPTTGRKAYHPEEVERSNGALTINRLWYLEAQIHPPINRLCAHIDGTSSPQLAHCLGLNTSKFIQPEEENNQEISIPSVLQNDADRFDKCVKLQLKCFSCGMENIFPGITVANTFDCPECKSEYWGLGKPGLNGLPGDNFIAVVSNRLSCLVRGCTGKYYDSWIKCTDETCSYRTKQQSLRDMNGKGCLRLTCRGPMKKEYSDEELYTQLKYFQSLIDLDRANERFAKGQMANKVPTFSARQLEIIELLYQQMEQTIRRNEYNWVQPKIWSTLFTTTS